MAREPAKSSLKLADALEECRLLSGDARLIRLIRRARANYYHDFFGVPALPEITLVEDLNVLAKSGNAHVKVIIQRVIDGDFDATKEESDEWAASEDGQETFRHLTQRLDKHDKHANG